MKIVYIVLGSISLGLGILGIFLPVLPTTPFLLLAAGLYCKGSPKLYDWLLNNRYLGAYIRNYRENKAITLRNKVVSVATMWATILLSAFLAVDVWWLRVVLMVIAAAVTWHILSFKTLKKTRPDNE